MKTIWKFIIEIIYGALVGFTAYNVMWLIGMDDINMRKAISSACGVLGFSIFSIYLLIAEHIKSKYQ